VRELCPHGPAGLTTSSRRRPSSCRTGVR
jgi:hypothetical protein